MTPTTEATWSKRGILAGKERWVNVVKPQQIVTLVRQIGMSEKGDNQREA
jgi:hypothetical protein